MAQQSFQPGFPFHQDVTDSLEVRRRDRLALIAAVAAEGLRSNQRLTKKQRTALHELKRADAASRYSFKLIDLLLDAMAGAANPMVFAEAIRSETIRRIGDQSMCVEATWLEEGRKQGLADVHHDQFILERIPVRRDQALDYLVPHREALCTAINALHAWTPNGRKFV